MNNPIEKPKKQQSTKSESRKELKKIEPPKLEATPLKAWKDGTTLDSVNVLVTGVDPIKKITGTKDSELAQNFLFDSAHSIAPIFENLRKKGPAEGYLDGVNIMAQSLNDFQPRDAIEAGLITQATALYQHGMDRLGRAGRSDTIPKSESQVNMAIKLLRLRNETIEAIIRYRRGGEQRVIVQHVNVNDGGQAIVGHVTTGGGGLLENGGKNPCSESAAQRPDQMAIDHAVSQQCQTGSVDCTVDCAPAQKRPKEFNG